MCAGVVLVQKYDVGVWNELSPRFVRSYVRKLRYRGLCAYRFYTLMCSPPNIHTEDTVAAPFAFACEAVETYYVV